MLEKVRRPGFAAADEIRRVGLKRDWNWNCGPGAERDVIVGEECWYIARTQLRMGSEDNSEGIVV